MRRYYELVVSGRQLAGLLAALTLLLLLAFFLGVGVGFLQGRGGELAGSGTESPSVALGAENSSKVKPGFAEPVPSPSPLSASQLAGAVEYTPTPVPSPAGGGQVTKEATAPPSAWDQGRVTAEAQLDEPSLAGRSEGVRGAEPAGGGQAGGVPPEAGSQARPRPGEGSAAGPPREGVAVGGVVAGGGHDERGSGSAGPRVGVRGARPRPGEGSAAGPPRERWVQVAALSHRSEAEGVRQRVIALGFRPEQVVVLPLEGGKYRVRVGPFPDRESGSRVAARLRAGGFPRAFVVGP